MLVLRGEVGRLPAAKERMAGFRPSCGEGPLGTAVREVQNGERNGRHPVRGVKESSPRWIGKASKGAPHATG
ncbi:hypothetical protein ACFXG6_26645 [Streptomyces roseus]|uniref:hypothetical protein n=1 Tax=Streptomyces roseus TaxID=66430 RepID=UPI0036B51A39